MTLSVPSSLSDAGNTTPEARLEMTMRRNRKRSNDPFDHVDDLSQPFLPDESTESARAVAIDLRDRLARLEQQMQSQYSAMAAYATISQQAIETARAEGRHDIDRSQSTVIGLIEKVRRDSTIAVEGVESRLGGGPNGDPARLNALESRLTALERVLATTLDTQQHLVQSVSSLMQERMQREGWLFSGGSAEDLSLR